MGAGCKIYTSFERPSKELVESFRGLPVANIDDNMGRTAALHTSVNHINMGKGQMVGVAFTVKVPEGDNLMFHKAMDMAQPGDVIMIDAGGADERAILGALMVNYCKARGIAGIVVDGSIRDYEELSAMTGFHIYAKGINPNGPYKNGPGEIGGVITVGNRVVHPGDIIVGDDDGVIVIRPEDAAQVQKAAAATLEKETATMETILKEGKFDRPWVDQKLKEIGCEII